MLEGKVIAGPRAITLITVLCGKGDFTISMDNGSGVISEMKVGLRICYFAYEKSTGVCALEGVVVVGSPPEPGHTYVKMSYNPKDMTGHAIFLKPNEKPD